MNKLRVLLVGMTLAVLLAACGASPTATPAPTSPPPAATATTAPTMAPTEAPTMAPTTAPTEAPTTAPTQYTVMSATNPTLGAILVDGQRMTLYTFSIDKPGESMCTGACAQFWPPLTVPAGTTPTAGAGIAADRLSTFQRADGTTQVAIDMMPLYTFVEDKAPDDANGQGLDVQGGYWYVVPTDDAPGAPNFAQYGFPNVLATEVITPGKAYTITADVYTVSIPDGAFDIPVKFELLSGDPTSFTPPSGETPEFAFAFLVENARMAGMTIGKFYKPLMLTIKSPKIVAGSKYYNVATDGTLSENPTGLKVTAGELQHPIAGAPVGWLVTSPSSTTPVSPTATPTTTTTLRTPQEAALAAAGGQKIGGTVEFMGPWGGAEQDSFMAVLAPFQEATGIKVEYTGSRDLIAVVTTRVQGGNPPDMTDFANPGQLLQFASAGNLQPLNDVLDMTTYQQQYAKTWLDLATYNNQLYGVLFKAAVKGLIWYDPKVWSADNYQIPTTWDDMMTLSKNIMDSGNTPWCVALESGAASGWPGTDWLEDIVLRQSGQDVYNQWWQGKIKWTSSEIKQAWQTWGEIVATSGMVYGGSNAMLSTNFGDVGNGLFTTPPNCYMAHQASFIGDFFTSNNPGVQPVTDFTYFPFPPFNASAPKATETGGDLVAMFNKTPQAEALMRYLSTPEAQAIWAKRGGGYLSANKDVPGSVYPDQLSRDEGNLLTSVQVVVFDASDQMPAQMTSAFYSAVLDYVQNPSSLDSILSNLDSVQTSAYSGQ
jgi:alpha-glucoside transport system substrate-binding protein